MISYTKRYVNIISLIMSIIIYIISNNTIVFVRNNNFNPYPIFKVFRRNIVQVELSSNNINQDTKENNTEPNNHLEINKITEDINWKIIIPSIGLEANISEGTRKEILDEFVGHFEETTKIIGNVGLAAHNRGYNVNYFSNLKKLKQGDKIIYQYNDIIRTYIVEKHVIIKDTDWTYLEETKENKITLITCIENEPEYRRCIQAIEGESQKE